MDNNQNNGQPIEGQGFVQPQMQQYGQSQQGFEQPQMQQQYGQPQQYQQMQQPYGQPQQHQQYQQPYGQPQMQVGPKKPVNKKAIAIVASVLVVAILAIVLVPKLFKDKQKTPFDGLKMGMSMQEVAVALDIEPEFDESTWYKRDVEAFGAVGRLQIIFNYDDEFDHVNWYVDREDCSSSKAYDKAIEEIKDYYTDKYGEPEYDPEENEYNWELSMGLEYELEIQDEDEFVLRYR